MPKKSTDLSIWHVLKEAFLWVFTVRYSTPLHKNIHIEFELGGEPFDAVGYMTRGEEITGGLEGNKALKRVDNGLIVRTQEDWEYVCEHVDDFPEELDNYGLVSDRPIPGIDDAVSILFEKHNGKRDEFREFKSWRWRANNLVLRRRKVA